MTTETPDNPQEEQKNAELAGWLSQAWSHHANKDYSQAESLFSQALRAYPDADEAAYGLGLSLKQSGRPAEAIQFFQKTLTLLEGSSDSQDTARRAMLRRLVNAHLSMLSS